MYKYIFNLIAVRDVLRLLLFSLTPQYRISRVAVKLRKTKARGLDTPPAEIALLNEQYSEKFPWGERWTLRLWTALSPVTCRRDLIFYRPGDCT